jgi:hypothetical protein
LAVEAMQARRLAMLRRFMAAGRAPLRPFIPFRKRKSKRRGWRGKGGGSAAQIRAATRRAAKRAAFLLLLMVAAIATQNLRRQTSGQRFLRQRPPRLHSPHPK